MPTQDPKYALLPVYLILDTSYSMQDGDKFNAALSFLPKLLSSMTDSATLGEKIRVEVITFDEDARVELSLGDINELEDRIVRNKKNPIVPNGDCTYYGKAFEKLYSQIQVGVRQIQSKTVGGDSYKAYRPVAFFITDGEPNDEQSARKRRSRSLQIDSG